jgi:uncharacterized protein YmfQ (DUF2313 family)
MPLPITTAENALRTLYALLPPGRLWDYVRTGASRASDFLRGLAEEGVRANNTTRDLWQQLDPRNALDESDWTVPSDQMIALLPRMEALYGLPDPAIGTPATTTERRALLHSRVISTGGQSAAYYIELADALLGVTITITDPYASGGWTPLATPIYPFYTLSASYSWLVTAPAATPAAKRTALEAIMNRYKPAHTAVYFDYV